MSKAVNDAKTFQRNAKGVRELLSMKFETLAFEGAWYDAFGTPERRGVWMVWGNTGNGKTSFVMQLCKELVPFRAGSLRQSGGRRLSDDAEHAETLQYAGGKPPFPAAGR